MDEMRAILDSLMGTDRNSVSSLDGGSRASFKNSDVCHFYLLDFCPHDLFPNTKSDLGPCSKKHSDAFREQFLADPEHDYYVRRYEREFINALQRLVDNVEQRIRKGNERILGPDETRLEQDKQKKVDAFKQEISQLLTQAQEAGEKGNIAEAEVLTRKTTEVRCSLDRLNSTSTNYLASLSAQEKSLRVCPVCGAMQSLGDAASRFESHVTGKQHVGYERIRATLAELRARHDSNPLRPSTKHTNDSETVGSTEEKSTLDKKSLVNTSEEIEKKNHEERSTHSPSPHRTKRYRSSKTSRRSNYRDSSHDRSLSSRRSSRRRSWGRSHRYDDHLSSRQRPRRANLSPHCYSSDYSRSRRRKDDNSPLNSRHEKDRDYHSSREKNSSRRYTSSHSYSRKDRHSDNKYEKRDISRRYSRDHSSRKHSEEYYTNGKHRASFSSSPHEDKPDTTRKE